MSARSPVGRASIRGAGRLSLLLLIAVAPALEAQVQPPEAPPPDTDTASPPPETARPPQVDQPIAGGRPVPGGDASLLVPVATERRRTPWGFQLRAGEGWVRNPGAIPGGTAGSYAARASAAVAYQRTGERGVIRFSGDGVGTRYHEYPDLNNIGGGGSITVGQILSPRAFLTLGESLQTRFAYENALLTSSGVFLGPVRTLTNVANAGLEYRLGSVTALVLDARHEHVAFDSTVLNDGSQFAASATVTHRRSALTGLAASYLLGVSSGVQRWATHTGFGSWRRKLGTRWTSGLSLGVTHSTQSASNFPYVVAELEALYARASLSARFGNNVSLALGRGYEQEMTTFGLTARRPLGRWLTASLSGSYADSRGVAPHTSAPSAGAAGAPTAGVVTQPPRYRTLQASGFLRVRITPALGLELDAFTMRMRPGPGTAPATLTDTVTAGAGLAFVYEAPKR